MTLSIIIFGEKNLWSIG